MHTSAAAGWRLAAPSPLGRPSSAAFAVQRERGVMRHPIITSCLSDKAALQTTGPAATANAHDHHPRTEKYSSRLAGSFCTATWRS